MNKRKQHTGLYNHLVRIYKVNTGSDGQGGGEGSGSLWESVYMSKKTLTGDRALQYSKLSHSEVVEFRTRYLKNNSISAFDYFMYEGLYFHIRNIGNDYKEAVIITEREVLA